MILAGLQLSLANGNGYWQTIEAEKGDVCRFRVDMFASRYTYLSWIKQFIVYNGKRHPVDFGAAEVELFLTYLAAKWHVSSSTQN